MAATFNFLTYYVSSLLWLHSLAKMYINQINTVQLYCQNATKANLIQKGTFFDFLFES